MCYLRSCKLMARPLFSADATRDRKSLVCAWRIWRLMSSNCCGCMEKAFNPSPSSKRVIVWSPAISPQTETDFPNRSPALMVLAIKRSTAGCKGSYKPSTSLSARSIAKVYWTRSFVPIDRKSSSWAKGSMAIAMAGTSTIAPI